MTEYYIKGERRQRALIRFSCFSQSRSNGPQGVRDRLREGPSALVDKFDTETKSQANTKAIALKSHVDGGGLQQRRSLLLAMMPDMPGACFSRFKVEECRM